MIKKEFFKTPIWVENKPEYLKSLTKASDKYIKEARKSKDVKEYIKHYGDFGTSYHSTPLTFDNDFLDKMIVLSGVNFNKNKDFDIFLLFEHKHLAFLHMF